jgi:hypothetical protein
MKSASFRLKMAAITLTALTAMPCLANAAISSSVDVTPPPTKLTAEEWRSLSLSASRILKHTDQALTALADKNNEGALTNIGQGLKLVEIINSVLPASKVTTNIKNGALEYKDADDVKPGFVPIYREYDSIDVLSPVTEVKQFYASTRQPGTVPDVAYAALDYTSVKLDVRLAKRDLESAQELVKKDDVKAATAALRGILTTGVVFEFSSTDQPLVRAMDNLRLADTEFMANHPDQAKFALAGASDALKNYEKLTGDSRSKEAAGLRKEIDEVANDLAKEKSETFTTKVGGWWGRCRNWISDHT